MLLSSLTTLLLVTITIHLQTNIHDVYDEEHGGGRTPNPVTPNPIPNKHHHQIECLYDNGFYDGREGYINLGGGAFDFRWRLLDDFEVPAGPGDQWIITGIRWYHVYFAFTPDNAVSPFLEIKFRSDAGAAPGLKTGGSISVASYQEQATGDIQLNRTVKESLATFTTPVSLTPGVYWFEANIVSTQPNYWLTRASTTGSELWINFDDFFWTRFQRF